MAQGCWCLLLVVVGGVVRTQSISIVAEDVRENGIDVDTGAMQPADVNANVDARRTKTGEVTYHGERNHQGLGNELIDPLEQQSVCGLVRRRQRLGRILSFYYRAA